MRKIAILIIVVFIVACDRYGEIINTHGIKLISIEYIDGIDSWMEKFSYDSLNRLILVTEMRMSGGMKYAIEYENEKIRQFRTYRTKDGDEIDRDSIRYSLTGQIENIYGFNGDSRDPDWLYEYEYDLLGDLSIRRRFYYKASAYVGFEKYYWENGNVIRKEEYNEDWELFYEFFYTYDDKVNYRNIIPYFINDPVIWSKNNLTEVTWNDYQGDLDIICRPCITKYDYNLDGYPVKILQSGTRGMVLDYE